MTTTEQTINENDYFYISVDVTDSWDDTERFGEYLCADRTSFEEHMNALQDSSLYSMPKSVAYCYAHIVNGIATKDIIDWCGE